MISRSILLICLLGCIVAQCVNYRTDPVGSANTSFDITFFTIMVLVSDYFWRKYGS